MRSVLDVECLKPRDLGEVRSSSRPPTRAAWQQGKRQSQRTRTRTPGKTTSRVVVVIKDTTASPAGRQKPTS